MTVDSPDAKDTMVMLTTAMEVYPDVARFVLGNIQFQMIDEPQMPKTLTTRYLCSNSLWREWRWEC